MRQTVQGHRSRGIGNRMRWRRLGAPMAAGKLGVQMVSAPRQMLRVEQPRKLTNNCSICVQYCVQRASHELARACLIGVRFTGGNNALPVRPDSSSENKGFCGMAAIRSVWANCATTVATSVKHLKGDVVAPPDGKGRDVRLGDALPTRRSKFGVGKRQSDDQERVERPRTREPSKEDELRNSKLDRVPYPRGKVRLGIIEGGHARGNSAERKSVLGARDLIDRTAYRRNLTSTCPSVTVWPQQPLDFVQPEQSKPTPSDGGQGQSLAQVYSPPKAFHVR